MEHCEMANVEPQGTHGSPIWNMFDKVSTAWTVVGIVISIVTALITSALYVDSLLKKIDKLDTQVRSINAALNFGDNYKRQENVVLNGVDRPTRCPDGTVMRGFRLSGYDYRAASFDCVTLQPAPSP